MGAADLWLEGVGRQDRISEASVVTVLDIGHHMLQRQELWELPELETR